MQLAEGRANFAVGTNAPNRLRAAQLAEHVIIARLFADVNQQIRLQQLVEFRSVALRGKNRRQNVVFAFVAAAVIREDNGVISGAEFVDSRRLLRREGFVRADGNCHANIFRNRREGVGGDVTFYDAEFGQLFDAEIFAETCLQIYVDGTAAVAPQFQKRVVDFDGVSRDCRFS